jgi:hypothetical protein
MELNELKSSLDITSLDEYRKSKKKMIDKQEVILGFSSLVIFGVLYGYGYYQECENKFIMAFGGTLVLVVLPLWFLVKKSIKEYILFYKTKVLSPIFKILGLEVEYFPNNHTVVKKLFSKSKLLLSYTGFKSTFLVKGSYEKMAFLFADVRLDKERDQDTKEKFKGLYLNLDFEFNSQLIIDVLPDHTKNIDFVKMLNIQRHKPVKLNHDGFEKLFVVYSNFPEKARELLDDNFITTIINMRANHKKFWFTIRGGSLHIMIEDNNDYFEIDSKNPIEKTVEIHYDNIKMVYACLKKYKEIFQSKSRQLSINIFN